MIIINGNLADGNRNGYRQASRRVIVPEKDVGNGLAAGLTGIELRKEGVSVVLGPAFVERTAFDIYDHKRLPCGLEGFEQTLLQAHQFQ